MKTENSGHHNRNPTGATYEVIFENDVSQQLKPLQLLISLN